MESDPHFSPPSETLLHTWPNWCSWDKCSYSIFYVRVYTKKKSCLGSSHMWAASGVISTVILRCLIRVYAVLFLNLKKKGFLLQEVSKPLIQCSLQRDRVKNCPRNMCCNMWTDRVFMWELSNRWSCARLLFHSLCNEWWYCSIYTPLFLNLKM